MEKCGKIVVFPGGYGGYTTRAAMAGLGSVALMLLFFHRFLYYRPTFNIQLDLPVDGSQYRTIRNTKIEYLQHLAGYKRLQFHSDSIFPI